MRFIEQSAKISKRTLLDDPNPHKLRSVATKPWATIVHDDLYIIWKVRMKFILEARIFVPGSH
jgi:hypothetical protein